MLTQEYLKTIFSYNAETGNLHYIKARGPRKSGSAAGSVKNNGYLNYKIDGKFYLAHRVVWLFSYGAMPSQVIDHIDGNKLNNLLANLRECSTSENCSNVPKRAHNTSGSKGITWSKSCKKWQAQITVDKKSYTLGVYADKEDAIKAYTKFAKEKLGKFYHE